MIWVGPAGWTDACSTNGESMIRLSPHLANVNRGCEQIDERSLRTPVEPEGGMPCPTSY
jgi:hypothetical protein